MGDDKRNMVLAIVLSVIVLFGWQFLADTFFPPAPVPVQQQTTNQGSSEEPVVGSSIDSTLPSSVEGVVQSLRSRSEVLESTQRVTILKYSNKSILPNMNPQLLEWSGLI